MQVRSKAQYQKLQELLKQGSISLSAFEAKTKGVDPRLLPERISTNTKEAVKRHHANTPRQNKRAW